MSASSESRAPPERPWVAVDTKAVVFGHKDKQARKAIPRGAEFHIQRDEPPRRSFLLFRHRATPTAPVGFATVQQQPSAYVLATDPSGLLLLQVIDPGRYDPAAPELLFCDTHAGTQFRLPAIPSFSLRVEMQPDRSFGLIGNKEVDGSYLLAQLHPSSSPLRGDRLLCYSTATLQWFVKPLKRHVSLMDRLLNPCSEAAVLAHGGRLWWLALAYGVFVCDPFVACPVLHFVPLPADCEMREEVFHRVSIAHRRLVAPSEGQLRFVEVRGLSYEAEAHGDAAAPPPANPTVWMWTLVDAEPEAAEPWRFEYEAPFAEVWAHDSYVDAGLPHGVVPHVALVDPTDHGVVYFYLGSRIFGLDLRARLVVSCEECWAEEHRHREMIRTSRPMIHAWELLPRYQEGECWRRSTVQRTNQPNLFPHPAPRQEADSSSSSDEETFIDRATRNISYKMEIETDQRAVKKLEREHGFIDWIKTVEQVEDDSAEEQD